MALELRYAKVGDLEVYPAKTGLGAGFLALEIGSSVMTCEPVLFIDIVGFDCPQD